MPRIDIAVKGLFPTPVAAVELPDAATRNAELQPCRGTGLRKSPAFDLSL